MNEGQLWMTIGADNTQFDKTARDTNRKLNEMSQNVKAFSQGITSSFVEAAKSMAGFYAVAKAGTVFQDLIEKNDQFNKSLREVSTLSDEVANNLDSYKQKILELTTQIPIGADEAAKALYQINSAGHTGADGMAVLEASAKAAIGGVTDTATAADTITTVLNAYKMSASEAATVSDKLFTAVKLGKTTMGELGASIAQVAPVAASFGVSIDQVLGAVATLTKNGTPTVQAMTQIRAAIVALSDSLGATYFQTHTLQEGMKEIREQYPDNNKLKETLGRVEGFNAVLAMTGENASGAAEDLDKLTKSAGAAADAYSRMSGGKGNEMTRLQNNIMKEMTSLNDTVSEVVTNVAKKLNEAFDSGAIEGYIDVIKELVVVYGAYKAVAIAVAAVKAANTMITETAETAMYEAQAAELRKVIALKQTQAAVSGETAAAEGAELTARQAELAALQKEAAEVAKLLKEKAAEAAANLANAKSEQAMAMARMSSAERGVAMREQDLAAAIASGDALKVETAEIELQKAELEKNAAARRLSTANKEADIAASKADAAAKAAETAATGMDTAATTGDAVATGILTKAKLALTSALNKLKVALATNPLAVATVAITALGYAVYKLAQYFDDVREKEKGVTAGLDRFGRSAEDAKKATEELNGVYAKANAELKETISRLRAFKGSKEDEKKLVQELNSKYGEAMGYYSSVSDWYKALTQNSAKYCQQLKNEALIRNLANQAAENEQKIHDIKYNEDGSLKMYKTQGDVIGMYQDINGQVQVQRAKSEQKVAQEDLAKLRKANESIQKQMQAIFDDNAKIAQEIHNGTGGKGGTDAPKGDTKNKAYWEAQKEAVEKEIKDLDTEDAEFYKKLGALEKRKKAYEAQIAKYDPSKGESQRNKTKEELQKQLDARKELNQELLEMQAKNNDDQIALMEEGHNKRMREISNEYSKEQNEISKTALQWARQNREAGLKGDQTKGSIQIAGAVYGGLTDDQQTALDEAIKNAQDKMEKSTQELLQSDIQYMREYLKEYGTFQQQRYAIAQEYDEKIAKLKAGGASQGEIMLAQKQKERAISENYETDLLSRIDFATAFDKFGTAFKEPLEELRQELKNYIGGASFKGKKVEEQRAIIEALNNVEERLGGSLKGLNFAKVGKDIDAYNQAMKSYNAAIVNQEVAQEELTKAQKEHEKALKEGNKSEIESAKTKVDNAELTYRLTTSQVQSAQQMVNDAQNTLNESDRKLMESMQSIQNLAQGLSSGSASSLWNSIPTEIKNKAAAAISKALGGKSDLWSQIIGLILSILDTLKDGIGNLLQAIIQSIGDAVEGLLTEIGSGKTFARIGEAIYSLITSIIKGIGNLFSGGTFSKINWSGGNADEVNKATEENTRAIENNTRRIEDLKDVIDKSSGVQAVQAGQAAIEAQKEINADAMDTLMQQMGYHSAHHSNEYYLDNKTLAEKYAKERIKAERASGVNLGDVKELSDIYGLTPEQLKVIRDYMPETWRYLTEVGKYDKSEYWEAVVEQAGKLEGITEKVKENITQWSLDSVKDEFRSMLMDWDNDVMDFSESFAKHMTEAIIKMKMGEGGENSLEKRIEKWYNDYYESLATGNFSDTDQKKAMEEYQDIVNEGLAIRDNAYKLTGYSDILNQKATANGIESITADQADQLIGRMTAIQIAVEADKNTMEGTLTQLIMISSLTTQGNAYLSDILSQHAIGNSYLEDIAKYSKAMSLELDGKMQKIVDGLNRL